MPTIKTSCAIGLACLFLLTLACQSQAAGLPLLPREADPPVVPSFTDVPLDYWAYSWIERLYASHITMGCNTDPLRYCPEDGVARANMAIFLERGMRGIGYTPPAGTGTIFTDVPATHWAAGWVEVFYADGMTSGCSTSPLKFCPDHGVTRAEMAVFLLRTRHGASYTPPTAAGLFADVPASHWAINWIEQLYAEGTTSGCGTAPLIYCPDVWVTRAQMAVFLVRTFDLP